MTTKEDGLEIFKEELENAHEEVGETIDCISE